jgi:hypothetical protein
LRHGFTADARAELSDLAGPGTRAVVRLLILDHEEVVDGRFRRYYKLTENGCQALGTETERLAALARDGTGRNAS